MKPWSILKQQQKKRVLFFYPHSWAQVFIPESDSNTFRVNTQHNFQLTIPGFLPGRHCLFCLLNLERL